jgi:hypothetical protein
MTEQGPGATEAPISWRSIVYGTPVIGPDGGRIGTVREVLGSDADDIFHGLRVRPDDTNRDVMIEADDVASLAANGIGVTVDRAAVAAQPDFDEPATCHLSSVGWLRHHLGWKDDSKGDEEPG